MVIHYGEQVSLVDSPTVLVFIMLLSSIAFVNTQVSPLFDMERKF